MASLIFSFINPAWRAETNNMKSFCPSATMTAKMNTLQLLLVVANITDAFGTMYEAYYLKSSDFVTNRTEQQMTEFMCSVYAGKNGHTAFRISSSGKCKLGSVNATATQNRATGKKTYVMSGISIPKCVISPTIAASYGTYNNPSSNVLTDNQQDSNSAPNNFWTGSSSTTVSI